MDKPEFKITAETGKILKSWAEKGIEPPVRAEAIEVNQDSQEDETPTTIVSEKCQYCGTVGKYHKSGCPSLKEAGNQV